MGELTRLSALELLAAYRARTLSPVEVVEVLLSRRIEATDPMLKAFATLTRERAHQEAKQAERAYSRSEGRPLEGVPVAVKDVFDTAE